MQPSRAFRWPSWRRSWRASARRLCRRRQQAQDEIAALLVERFLGCTDRRALFVAIMSVARERVGNLAAAVHTAWKRVGLASYRFCQESESPPNDPPSESSHFANWHRTLENGLTNSLSSVVGALVARAVGWGARTEVRCQILTVQD
jgi:hypothetical protein